MFSKALYTDEKVLIKEFVVFINENSQPNKQIEAYAHELALKTRELRLKKKGIDVFLSEYSLSTAEGLALMCLAEAFLRVPDRENLKKLVKDKISKGNWEQQSSSNFTAWGLILTKKIFKDKISSANLLEVFTNWCKKQSETVVISAIYRAMKIMSCEFVLAENIQQALSNSKAYVKEGFSFSFDMLGEAALTKNDAAKYLASYLQTINKIEQDAPHSYGVSIKLSALHPRYFEAQKEQVISELSLIVKNLALKAAERGIDLTIDAEESSRLEISLDIFRDVLLDASLKDYEGLGIAVQAYQKRAFYVLDYLDKLAQEACKKINVRLIKGAYWDSEIKQAQMQGLAYYPVFTKKNFTDISYHACVLKLLGYSKNLFAQFATHNAYSVAFIEHHATSKSYEFQCLFGMGAELFGQIKSVSCRIYAPIGTHQELLPYLVRRLLENGANTSFVNQLMDSKRSIASLVSDPLSKINFKNSLIPLPKDIFANRLNSQGLDLYDRQIQQKITQELQKFLKKQFSGKINSFAPFATDLKIGAFDNTPLDELAALLKASQSEFNIWSALRVEERVLRLTNFAELLQANIYQLIAYLCYEAGKTWKDALAEVREAIDFCRYYALSASKLMAKPQILQGYTGETNELTLHPKGVILCISPWNFPLAIFIGQIVAALAVGNAVVAKPAEQTPLIANFVAELFKKAKIYALTVLNGSGSSLGDNLVKNNIFKTVLFTGSTATAKKIQRTLALKEEITPLIAETGGQNAMIVDSTTLLEQAVSDIIESAFGSAGQRCSALRVLFVQEEIYKNLVEMLTGAMAELVIGDPRVYSTDIGPVIDKLAAQKLQEHINKHRDAIIFQCEISEQRPNFIAPTLISLTNITQLEQENFGPVLHIISYNKLDEAIAQINSTGYGLTLGVHTRIDSVAQYVRESCKVGNFYVNRNIVGAVVGLQPFGGEGLSGTGPKAGGPYSLLPLVNERVYSVDTTAAGGNASLLANLEE